MAKTKTPKRMTPMLKQYFGVKHQYPDAILFFRMGDFFEVFFEDAKIAAEVLGIALTSRSKDQDMPMAGVPVRAVDTYLQKLIRAGHTVVICDQVQDPKDAKGIVDRAVTRIVTAGTVLEDALLQGSQHNFLAALAWPTNKNEPHVGIAWVDISTGRFEGNSVPVEDVREELARRTPAELLLAESLRDSLPAMLKFLETDSNGPSLSFRPDHEFEHDVAHALLLGQFGVATLEGFGIDNGDPLVRAAGAALHYVRETQCDAVQHLKRLRKETGSGKMTLDPAARSALELLETSREQRRQGSLLWCIDRTRTAAGGRLLRDWILEPLTELGPILERQEAVAEGVEDSRLRQSIREQLERVFDIERITARLALHRGSPRDLAQLRDSLTHLPTLFELLESAHAAAFQRVRGDLVAPEGMLELLTDALVEAPPMTVKDGGVIKGGFSTELDELTRLKSDSKAILAEIQRKEIERTGINNLKIGFHSVFGYYLEVTEGQKDRVPADYIRKQTLKNCERYITPELKEHESKALMAKDNALKLELELFEKLRSDIAMQVEPLQQIAAALAELDATASLAEASHEHGYRRPKIDESLDLEIIEGYHPVLAKTLGKDSFVPNDTELTGERQRLGLITGPNMAGKSTYLRQTALVVILAQIGCFVPAKSARVGLVDRVFTRVGASDDLVKGASTFMVEMTETANILHHATERSLVILDEIGRGTGTFDGLSLARALAESFAETVRCRTLFATHYHQLTQLAEEFPSISSLCVAVREWGEEIVFLYRIEKGGTDRSYGIHVARLAGVPEPVLVRAKEILTELETLSPELRVKTSRDRAPVQEKLFEPPTNRLYRALQSLDVNQLTPIQALNELVRLQALTKGTKASKGKKKSTKQQEPTLFEAEGGA